MKTPIKTGIYMQKLSPFSNFHGLMSKIWLLFLGFANSHPYWKTTPFPGKWVRIWLYAWGGYHEWDIIIMIYQPSLMSSEVLGTRSETVWPINQTKSWRWPQKSMHTKPQTETSLSQWKHGAWGAWKLPLKLQRDLSISHLPFWMTE